MRTKWTFDPVGLLFLIAALLMVGVIPFTAGWIGGLLILGSIHMPMEWS